MTRFPESVKPKLDTEKERSLRKAEIRRSIITGILLRFTIVIAELAGVIVFGSAALFMDALSSAFDIASSLLLIIFIKLAERPPDEDHPFGHGRYEPLAGLQLGLILAFIGASMIVQQISHLGHEGGEEPLHPWIWIIPAAAVVLLEISYRVVMRTARKRHSTALAADAIHYRVDALTSLLAAVTLLIAQANPFWSVTIDSVGAIAIALFMIGLGMQAARSNMHQLLDRMPGKDYFSRVRKAAKTVAGVMEIEKLRIQHYGPDAHVDIDVEVDPALSVENAHRISQNVRAAIQEAWPEVRDVTVHIEPYYPGDHAVSD